MKRLEQRERERKEIQRMMSARGTYERRRGGDETEAEGDRLNGQRNKLHQMGQNVGHVLNRWCYCAVYHNFGHHS